MKESYVVKLSCLKRKTKFKRHCSRFSFDGLPQTIGVSPIDHAWEMIVGTTMDAKSTNSMVVKLVRFLNSTRVDLIVASTSQTLIVIRSTKWPLPSSISIA
jgi:hypothetical protein